MDLQDFVTTALCQISAGVASAKNYDRCIAPRVLISQVDPKVLRTLASEDAVFVVEFDVAVTTLNTSENGAAGSIAVLSVPAGKRQPKRTTETSSANRVKFSVPITYR